jgi:hypothetical protein
MRSLFVKRTCWAASLSLALLLAIAPVLGAQTLAADPSGDAKVDINTASLAALEKLPGVDQNTAKRIIAHRPYSSVADLSKSGVPASTIKRITPHVKVGPLGTAAAATAKGADKAATGVEKAADATATGIEKAANATATGVEKGVDAAAKGVQKGAEATAAAANTVDHKVTGAARVPPKPGMVWVDTNTNIYHKVGDASYGTTKKGKWLTEKEALKRGYRAVLPNVTIGQ